MFLQFLLRYAPHLIGVTFVSLALFFSGYQLAQMKADKVEYRLKAEMAEQERMHALEINKVREANQNTILDLNKRLDENQTIYSRKLEEETNAIEAKADATISDLRDNTIRLRDKYAEQKPVTCPTVDKRPADDKDSTVATRSDTADQAGILSDETAKFLVGLAKEADLTTIALKQCVGQYQSLENEFKQKDIKDENENQSAKLLGPDELAADDNNY